jgi:hypothetical protein
MEEVEILMIAIESAGDILDFVGEAEDDCRVDVVDPLTEDRTAKMADENGQVSLEALVEAAVVIEVLGIDELLENPVEREHAAAAHLVIEAFLQR